MDDHLQYWRVDARGSLAAQLSHSMVSQDAHLRNLLEVAVGRETSLLDFPVGFDYRALLPR